MSKIAGLKEFNVADQKVASKVFPGGIREREVKKTRACNGAGSQDRFKVWIGVAGCCEDCVEFLGYDARAFFCKFCDLKGYR